MEIWDFLPEFTKELKKQLEKDKSSHGQDWLKLTKKGQERRIYARFDEYWYNFANNDVPIPWLKIAGLAMIAWIREKHPELWQN